VYNLDYNFTKTGKATYLAHAANLSPDCGKCFPEYSFENNVMGVMVFKKYKIFYHYNSMSFLQLQHAP
jgi:hypothetical protein